MMRSQQRKPVRTILVAAACGALLLLTSTNARSDDFSPDRFGIGATLVQPQDSTFIEIRNCAPNGPAARAGLEVGDRLVELDGKPIGDWSFHQVMDYLMRSEPLPLRVTVRRGQTLVSVELIRMRISDIAAEQGIRWVPEGETYRSVPLHARPEVNIGDVVPLDSLSTPACAPTAFAVSGKSTVVYFWTTWCGPCKQLINELRTTQTQHRLIAINLDRECADFQKAVDSIDPPGDDAWAGGWYGRLSQVLGVYRRGVPTAALLDSDGRLLQVATGTDAIIKMMEGKP